MRIFVTILLDITIFGGGIPNLLVGKYVLLNNWRNIAPEKKFVFKFISSFAKYAIARASHKQRAILFFLLLLANFYRSFSVSNNVVGQSEKYEVSKKKISCICILYLHITI